MPRVMVVTDFCLALFREEKVRDENWYTLVFCSGLEFLEAVRRSAKEMGVVRLYWTRSEKPVIWGRRVGAGTRRQGGRLR